MPPITAWNPATKISRGNVSIGIATAVVDVNVPKVTELNASGTSVECSVETFNASSATDTQSIEWLCDPAAEQLPGTISHTLDDLVIKSTGQADSTLITSLAIGSVVYLWRRDGMAVATAPAIGQFIWVWKVIITSIDPLEANNPYVGIRAHITVLSRSRTAVALVA